MARVGMYGCTVGGRKERTIGEEKEVPLCWASTDDKAASPAFTAPCQSAYTVLREHS